MRSHSKFYVWPLTFLAQIDGSRIYFYFHNFANPLFISQEKVWSQIAKKKKKKAQESKTMEMAKSLFVITRKGIFGM